MDWFRQILSLLAGVGRAVFGVPARAWSVVRWLFLLGLLGASFVEDARIWVGSHPWLFGVGLLAYGALLYAYDLQVRIERLNQFDVVAAEAEASFVDRTEEYVRREKRSIFNVFGIRFKYTVRNRGEAAMHPFPGMALLVRDHGTSRWRKLAPDELFQASVHKVFGGKPDRTTSLNPGGEAEVLARRTTAFQGGWRVSLPGESGIQSKDLRMELTVELVGQEPVVRTVPIEVTIRSAL